MKFLGIILLLIGGALIAAGLLYALQSFSSIYSNTLADPLNAPESDGQHTRATMLQGVYIAAPGAVLFIIGRIMLIGARRRSRRTGH